MFSLAFVPAPRRRKVPSSKTNVQRSPANAAPQRSSLPPWPIVTVQSGPPSKVFMSCQVTLAPFAISRWPLRKTVGFPLKISDLLVSVA